MRERFVGGKVLEASRVFLHDILVVVFFLDVRTDDEVLMSAVAAAPRFAGTV